MLKFLVFAFILTCVYGSVEKGVVLINNNDITGTVTFTKSNDGSIKVEGTIKGLPAGKHGFHIHEKGDLGDACVAAGGHFNPLKKDHGAPTDDNRHVGDLGNIVADDTKTANINIVDKLIALDGQNSIIGRALVIHSGEDDLGLGGQNDSKTTGHAGSRLACGVVGIALGTTSGIGLSPTGGYFILLLATYITLRNFFLKFN